MAELKDIIDALDNELRIAEIPDYPGALNGLQLQNGGQVTKIATAVDATLPVITKAVESGADLLIVHHGMFWQGPQKIVGPIFEKIRMAMDAGLAIYASHIPLDVHPTMGNNAVLARKLAPEADWQPFFDWKGIKLGLRAELSIKFNDLAFRLKGATGADLLLEYGDPDSSVGHVGVITGGAGSEVGKMPELSVNTFITGEAPHWAHGLVEEWGVNLLLGGHYSTETFGVEALGIWLRQNFAIETVFIPHPSGL